MFSSQIVFFSPPFFSFLCICTINLEYIIVFSVVFCFNDRESNKNKVKTHKLHVLTGSFTTHAKHYPGAILCDDHNFLMSNKCLQTQTTYPSVSFSSLNLSSLCQHEFSQLRPSIYLILHVPFHKSHRRGLAEGQTVIQ